MNQKILLFIVGMVFFLMGCGALKDKMSPPTVQELGIKTLRAGVAANYPPIIFKEKGNIAGIEADLADQLSRQLGVEVQFVEKPFKELIPALNKGDIDMIMSGMSVTERRQAVVQFVEPYMTVGQVAIVRARDKERFASPKEALYVNGLRVGCESKTSGMTFVANTMLLAEIIQYDSVDAGLEGLRNGEIFAFIHDSPTAWRIAADPSAKDLAVITQPLTEESLAWALHKDNKGLYRILNHTMREWKKSGKIKPILDKWMPALADNTKQEGAASK